MKERNALRTIQRDKLILALDTQLKRAIQDDENFSVIACVAQGLPDENFDDIISVADVCLRAALRDNDRSGRLDRSTIIMGLPGTSLHEAKSLASRLIGDFSVPCTFDPRHGEPALRRFLNTVFECRTHRDSYRGRTGRQADLLA